MFFRELIYQYFPAVTAILTCQTCTSKSITILWSFVVLGEEASEGKGEEIISEQKSWRNTGINACYITVAIVSYFILENASTEIF
jgi:hypothetical protein